MRTFQVTQLTMFAWYYHSGQVETVLEKCLCESMRSIAVDLAVIYMRYYQDKLR